jgi:hypothetical protein
MPRLTAGRNGVVGTPGQTIEPHARVTSPTHVTRVTRPASSVVRQIMHTVERRSDERSARPGPIGFRHGRQAAWAIPIGIVVGTALGVIARGWMRLLADDPEFTWSGTIFIVAAFTITGFGHATAWAALRTTRRRRWATPVRIIGGFLTLPLFVGAGGMMLPTVAGASLARWRGDWPRPARVAMIMVATPIPVVLAVQTWRDGFGWRQAAGLLLLAATYTIVVTTIRPVVAPLDDGWRMPRFVRIVAIAAGVLVLTAMVVLVVGVSAADDLT